MQRLILLALVAGAGYLAWVENAGGPDSSTRPSGNGGAGFSSFGKAAGNVAGGAIAAVKN